MRVCMLQYGEFPSEPRARRAAEALAGAGHAVTVLALLGSAEAGGVPGASIDVRRVPGPAHLAGRNPLARKARTWTAVRRIHREWLASIAGQRFDVFHANNLDTLQLASGLAKQHGAAVVYDAHELWVEYVSDRGGGAAERLAALPTRWYWTLVEWSLLPRVDAAITVNRFIAREMAERYGVPEPEVVLNVTATPPAGVEPLPVAMPGLSLIYQGVLSEGRGLPELLEAVARVPGANVTVMGAGVLAESLARRAAQPDLLGRAAVVGAVAPERVVPIARSADIGVIPFVPTTLNNRYASPNKLFEYMHAGLGILGSDLPFIRDVLDETGAGTVVPPGDVDEWAKRISAAVDDRTRVARWRERAAQAAHLYTWETEKEKLLAVYDRLGGVRRPVS